MSRRPIDLSPDLLRLQNEGYDIDIRGAYLLAGNVPYVDSDRTIKRGTLISKLNLSADVTNKPDDHVAYWTGKHPCHADGSKIRSIENASAPQSFGDGVQADFTFSAKADYRDYHHKMTTYIGRIAGEAAKIDENVSARVYAPIAANDTSNVFKYLDTASSRAGIGAVNAKIAGQRIGIAGLGGTGAYVLDFVSKTAVAEIHAADGDIFSQHNAFRAPGAASLEQLQAKLKKTTYFRDIYGNMHNGIVMHDVFLDEANLHLFDGLDFVFICLDQGEIKRALIERLTANGTPFVEVGMGVILNDNSLSGVVRAVASTGDTRALAAPHISFSENVDGANEYATNIQIAELNAFNAVMAVILWKKHFGFYDSAESTVYSGYSLRRGEIVLESADAE